MAVSDFWPAPAALSGVKNKKKPIFKIASAAIAAPNGSSLDVVDVTLSLESRVLALGDEGRLLAGVLLGKDEVASGKVTRHEQLAVLRLGPELAGSDGSAGQHKQAVLKALQEAKPQVVVLDDAGASHGGWARAFNEIVRGDALKSFKGAVVVCSSEETFALCSACEERWAVVNDKLRQGPFGNGGLEIVEDALAEVAPEKAMPKRRAREAADGTAGLLAELRDLSLKWFEEDVEAICRKEGWTLTLLVGTVSDENGRLKGYLCYETRPDPFADLHVHRVCVPRRLRSRGHGSLLMRWAMEKAQQLPDEVCRAVTTDSLELAVPFYTKIGFANRGEKQILEGEDEQILMEWDASLDVPAAGM